MSDRVTKEEKLQYKAQQDAFISAVLDALTGSDSDTDYIDHLGKFLRLFPHVGEHVDRILAPAYKRHKDFERGLLIATIFECLNRL